MAGLHRVLITGVNGFVGAAAAHFLAAEGFDVYGTVRPASKNHERLRSLHDIEIIESDYSLACLSRIASLLRPSSVLHLAAAGVVDRGPTTHDVLQANIVLTLNLAQAFTGVSLQNFIHVGSCFEYGQASFPQRIREDAPLVPLSLYAASKGASFLLLRPLARQLSIPLTVLRLFGTYGLGEDSRRLIPSLVHNLLQNRIVRLTMGLQVRDFLHVEDVARAFLAAILSSRIGRRGEVYNVCSGVPIQVRQIGTLVAEYLGRSPSMLHWGALPSRADEYPWIVGDNTLFRAATRWNPNFTVAQGMRNTVDSLRGSYRIGAA